MVSLRKVGIGFVTVLLVVQPVTSWFLLEFLLEFLIQQIESEAAKEIIKQIASGAIRAGKFADHAHSTIDHAQSTHSEIQTHPLQSVVVARRDGHRSLIGRSIMLALRDAGASNPEAKQAGDVIHKYFDACNKVVGPMKDDKHMKNKPVAQKSKEGDIVHFKNLPEDPCFSPCFENFKKSKEVADGKFPGTLTLEVKEGKKGKKGKKKPDEKFLVYTPPAADTDGQKAADSKAVIDNMGLETDKEKAQEQKAAADTQKKVDKAQSQKDKADAKKAKKKAKQDKEAADAKAKEDMDAAKAKAKALKKTQQQQEKDDKKADKKPKPAKDPKRRSLRDYISASAFR